MLLRNELSVPAPPERVFDVLVDAERAAACLPEARLLDRGAGTVRGELRVRVGRVSITYRGTLSLLESDREAGALELAVRADQVRGSGGARGTVSIRLRDAHAATTVSIQTDLELEGRAAEISEEAVAAAAQGLLDRFGAALSASLRSEASVAAAVAGSNGESGRAAQPPPEAAAGAGAAVAGPDGAPAVERSPVPVPAPEQAAGAAAAGEGAAPEGPAAAVTRPAAQPPLAGVAESPSAAGRGPEPERNSETEAAGEEPRPVPGVIRIVTPEPVTIGPENTWTRLRDAVEDATRDRPWLVPAVLMTLLAILLIVRRPSRED